MTDHARLSPSSRHRWGVCPGSVREEAKYPEQAGGPAAVDGTHSHSLLEHCVKGDLGDPTNMVGVILKDHEGEFTVTAERAQRVKIAIDYLRQRVSDAQGQCSIVSETRVNPEHLVGRGDLSGTVDIQFMDHSTGTLEIIDYKDGMAPVEAEGNPQLEQYAIGVLAGYQLPVNGNYPVRFVKMTIIQPKLQLRGLNPIVSHTVTVETLLDKIGELVVQAAATDKPDAPLIPGEKQCKYCRASGCSARSSQAMEAAGIAFPSFVSTPATATFDASTLAAQQDPSSMSNDRLREILDAAPLVRQMIEQAEVEAQRRMESGVTIPGLKLVNGRGSQVWNLKDDEVAEKLKGMGVPKEAIYKTSVVSPAQAMKLTWSKRDGTKKQLTERQLKTLETEYISKLAGKLTVAPESDPRPAVVRDAAPLFSAVESAPALPDWLK